MEKENEEGVMINRSGLYDKIRALLAKTTENGCTEAEMCAALDKAQAMIDAYAVTDQELGLSKKEAAVLHSEPKDATDPHKIKWQLCLGIENFCGVKIWRNRDAGYQFCGMKSDVEFAMWLLDHLTDFVHAELYAHLIGCLAPKSERKQIINGFVFGCCQRIEARMHELCKRSERTQTSNGRELVVIKSGAIDAKLKELGIRIRLSGAGCSAGNDAAREAGS
jgi:Protein of unknown function (DUF2786)